MSARGIDTSQLGAPSALTRISMTVGESQVGDAGAVLEEGEHHGADEVEHVIG